MKMKRFITAILLFALLTALMLSCGCSKYVSHYKAVGLVRTNTAHAASMSFSSFEGNNVFTLTIGKDMSKITYSATLEKGKAVVYYDNADSLQMLCTVSEGENIDAVLENLPEGRVDIVVETTEKCENGRFEFKVAD